MAPAVEKAMVDSGIILIKYWLEVGPDEQTRRLESRIHDPRKVWKLSGMDLKSYSRWFDYSRARDDMFRATDTAWAPWFVAHTDVKKRGRLNIITHLLSQIPYEPLATTGRETTEAAGRPWICGSGSPAAAHPGEILSSGRTSSGLARFVTGPICSTRRFTATPAISRAGQGSAMTSQVSSRTKPAATRWYALSPEDVAGRLGVDAVGRAVRGEGRRAAAAERTQRAARREDAFRDGGVSWISTAATCRSSC